MGLKCWSVKSTTLDAKDDNFKPVMGAQTKNLCYAQQILVIKGMGVGEGGWLSEPVNKRNIHEKSCFRYIVRVE